ncbi:MAG: heme exporter protein CcmB [Pseudomonadota bacterium]
MLDYFKFELICALRKKADLLLPIFFFLTIAIIVPFTTHPDSASLQNFAVSLIWVSLLLTVFLSVGRLFTDDLQDGFADRYKLIPIPEEAIFLVKVLILILTRLIPLTFIVPFYGLFYMLSMTDILRIIIMLWISSPALMFFTAFGALLCVELKQSGIYIFILILPLMIPALIFGAAGCDSAVALSKAIQLPAAFSLFAALLCTIFSRPLFHILHAGR